MFSGRKGLETRLDRSFLGSRIWPRLAFLSMLGIFLGLGYWQLDRAQQKREFREAYAQRMSEPPVDLNQAFDEPAAAEYRSGRKVWGSGHYDSKNQLLLDNQIIRGQAGYCVYTPFRLERGDRWVLVERGWMPVGDDRATAPAVAVTEARIVFHGVVMRPYRPPVLLSDVVIEAFAPGFLRVQAIDISRLEGEFLRRSLAPYVVQLDPGEPFGYVREQSMREVGEDRHMAYAVQWFALAGVLLVCALGFHAPRRG